ncbi:MAG: pyridoxamine 5'-phosphate oxidase family protein [Actinomycetota bacterium]|nr:pyridoxamine 5'-phosphate oxidase family protein [Actinomycetota bacterium]
MPHEPEADVAVTLEPLTRNECFELLATATVGRVGLLVDGKPEILPVNYVVEDPAVVFRTADDSVLTQAALQVVAFEVDDIDEATHSGWSVLVQGVAHDVSSAIDTTSEHLRRLALVAWAPGARHRWFRIKTDWVSGRRLRTDRREPTKRRPSTPG